MTVAVSALIVIIGVMNGLQTDLREKILIGSPDVRVLTFGEDMVMNDWQAVLAKVRRQPGVVAVGAVRAHAGGRSRDTSTSTSSGAFVEGIPPDGPGVPQVTRDPRACDGRRLHVRDARRASIAAPCSGRSWPNGSTSCPGVDSIALLTHRRTSSIRSPGMPMPSIETFEVTGIFDTGMYEYDNQYVIISLDAAQQLAQLGQAVTGLEVEDADAMGRAGGRRPAWPDSLGMPFRVARLAPAEQLVVQRAQAREARHDA